MTKENIGGLLVLLLTAYFLLLTLLSTVLKKQGTLKLVIVINDIPTLKP